MDFQDFWDFFSLDHRGSRARAWPSVDRNLPWSDLLTDVVLTSVGGLGVKGRGEGVVWAWEPLCPSVVASGGSKSSKIEGLAGGGADSHSQQK